MTRDEVTAAFERLTKIPDYGFSCDDGWMPLLGIIAREIAAIPKADRKGFRLDQVKEKWGTLRFYYSFGNRNKVSEISIVSPDGISSTRLKSGTSEARSKIAKIVTAAETASYFICEECGRPGRPGSTGSYVQTLCHEHAMEAGQTKREGGEIGVGPEVWAAVPRMLGMLSELWQRPVTLESLKAETGILIVKIDETT